MNALVDTSFLVRLRQPGTPLCHLCESALKRLLERGDALYLCAQTAIEFWSVATRPKNANGLGLTPGDAETALREAEVWCEWLLEPGDIASRWRKIVNRHGVIGRPVHDARLIALMEAYGLAHLLTLDEGDFTRYTNITVLHPNDVR
jgi:predicted nucleic acid-binding protein